MRDTKYQVQTNTTTGEQVVVLHPLNTNGGSLTGEEKALWRYNQARGNAMKKLVGNVGHAFSRMHDPTFKGSRYTMPGRTRRVADVVRKTVMVDFETRGILTGVTQVSL